MEKRAKQSVGISRRQFFGGAGVLAASGAFGAFGLAGCAPENKTTEGPGSISINFADTVEWDSEYDVVVIGWGGAGSVAAITAVENGAKRVLITEKAPYGDEGGNTRYCEQYAYTPASVEDGVAAMKAFAEGFDTATDEIVQFMAQGAVDNVEWILAHGAESFGTPPASASGGDVQVAWPPFEDLETWTVEKDGQLMLAGEWPIWPNGEANNGRMTSYQVNAPDNGEKKYWKLMRKNVVGMKENIDVWYESPAIQLIQDPFTKTVLGVKVAKKDSDVFVRALNGVVLSCGSYEASEEMIETFAQIPCGLPLGSTYNTGDGIKMATAVGADLWHMDALSGPWPTAKYHNEHRGIFGGTMPNRITVEGNCFYVGGNAKRFMKESDWHKHGHVDVGGTWISQQTPDIMWAIMDATARHGTGVISYVEDEEIIEASSIAELAEKIELDPATLQATADEYNAAAAAGEDPRFNRPKASLKPVETAPFYAVRLWPCFVNSQGGPKRNTKCEVIDVDGNPIPQLYSAGELGSMWAGVYSGGGNIAETMYSGREAGKNAAAVKEQPQAVELALVDYKPQSLGNDLDESEATSDVQLGENEYLGTGEGLHGPIVAKVTVVDGKVTAVEVIKQTETADITERVWSDMPKAMVEAGSAEVDTISGATLASNGLIAAVEDAVAQAK